MKNKIKSGSSDFESLSACFDGVTTKSVSIKLTDPERKKANMGRMMYGKGGYASIQDMEKQCMTKTDYNESLKSKD